MKRSQVPVAAGRSSACLAVSALWLSRGSGGSHAVCAWDTHTHTDLCTHTRVLHTCTHSPCPRATTGSAGDSCIECAAAVSLRTGWAGGGRSPLSGCSLPSLCPPHGLCRLPQCHARDRGGRLPEELPDPGHGLRECPVTLCSPGPQCQPVLLETPRTPHLLGPHGLLCRRLPRLVPGPLPAALWPHRAHAALLSSQGALCPPAVSSLSQPVH